MISAQISSEMAAKDRLARHGKELRDSWLRAENRWLDIVRSKEMGGIWLRVEYVLLNVIRSQIWLAAS